jgi:ZIP family zinc transporter
MTNSLSSVNSLQLIASYSVLPALAAIVGAAIAAYRRPGSSLRGLLQHLAAGVIFSVVAVELLPDIVRRQHPVLLAVGFSLGVALIMAIEHFAGESRTEEAEGEPNRLALYATLGIDVFIDGLLIAVGFSAGAKAGQLLAVALTVELLSTGLALSATLGSGGMRPGRIIAISAGLFSLIIVGGIVGALCAPLLTGAGLDLILAFGLAALLFLVTEQLLVEAHREEETPLATAMFFVGFLAFVLLGMEP